MDARLIKRITNCVGVSRWRLAACDINGIAGGAEAE